MNHIWLQTCEMYGMMSMILKYSSLIVPFTTEKITIVTIDS